jgi:RimJ/RimL family protein N-acetyltransferase
MTTQPWVLPASVRTERLLLRPHRPGDVDDLLVFHSDPDIVRYLPWPVRTRDDVVAFVDKRMTLTTAREDGDWVAYAIESRVGDDAGHVIGEVLLKRKDAARATAEVGYAIAAHLHGRGLASEAVTAMLELGATAFGVREVHAIVDERNAASIRLLERFGFTFAGPHPDEVEQQLVRYTRALAP